MLSSWEINFVTVSKHAALKAGQVVKKKVRKTPETVGMTIKTPIKQKGSAYRNLGPMVSATGKDTTKEKGGND